MTHQESKTKTHTPSHFSDLNSVPISFPSKDEATFRVNVEEYTPIQGHDGEVTEQITRLFFFVFDATKGKHSSHWCLDKLGNITSNGELLNCHHQRQNFIPVGSPWDTRNIGEVTLVCNVCYCNCALALTSVTNALNCRWAVMDVLSFSCFVLLCIGLSACIMPLTFFFFFYFALIRHEQKKQSIMLDCTMVFMLNAALKIHDEESESLTWNIYRTP